MQKLLHLISLVILLTVTSVSAAPGYDHGNGGGVICVNGHCQTLTESGLVLSAAYPDFWIPSEEVLANINDLISRYPFVKEIRTKILTQVLLKMTHFKVVDIVDPAKVEKIKQFYLQTIKATSPRTDLTGFQVVAISSDNTTTEQNTYILPEFFANLNSLQQAEILIHEGFYRGHPSSDLRYILQLESALVRFKNLLTPNQSQTAEQIASGNRKDMVSAQIAAYDLKILNKSEAFAHIVSSTYSTISSNYNEFQARSTFEMDQLFKWEFKDGDPKHILLTVNQNYVQARSYLDGRTAVMLLNLNTPVPLEQSTTYCDSGSESIWCEQKGFKLTYTYGEQYEYVFQKPDELNLLLPN